MTTKDYVYLGLMVLAAVVFYVHGFCAGAEQARKALSRFLQSQSTGPTPPEPRVQPGRPVLRSVAVCSRDCGTGNPRATSRIQGDFGNN